MALTIAGVKRTLMANKRRHQALITFDSSYTTGGMSLTARNLGMFKVENLRADPQSGYVFAYDATNKKVLAYRTKDPANAGGADIVMQEVANAVNLSAISTVVEAFGF